MVERYFDAVLDGLTFLATLLLGILAFPFWLIGKAVQAAEKPSRRKSLAVWRRERRKKQETRLRR